MRKLSALFLTGLLPLMAFAQAKETPYASSMTIADGWTNYDVNEDNKTWADDNSSYTWSGSGYTTGIKYSYHGSNAGNDWRISPAIHLEAGKEYKLKVMAKSGSFGENFKITLGTENTVANLAEGTVLLDVENHKQSSFKRELAVFTVPATGDYYFGAQCYSAADKYYLYMTAFEVCENVFAPAAPAKLTCTPGEERALTAKLTWELPTTDNDGAALPEGASFDEVVVMRDGQAVASLDGAATEWNDDASHGLTSGYHRYEVYVVVNGAKSAAAAVDSKYIGPVEPSALPYTFDFTAIDQETFDLLWASVKGRNSTSSNNWDMYTSSYYGNAIKYYGGNGKVQDDWLISPQVKITEPGIYRLKTSMKYGYDTKLEIYFGAGNSIGGYTEVVKTITNIPSDYAEYEIFVEVTEEMLAASDDKAFGFAFRACDDNCTNYGTLYINGFVVEKWKITPMQIADLTATVKDGTSVDLAWTNPVTSNTGADLTSLSKVELYCDDALVETFAEVAPGQAMTYNHTPATGGVHIYHALAYIGEDPADGEPVKVKTGWVGDETQPVPYSTSFATTDATAPIWSGNDANNDGFTWTIGTTAKLPVDKDRTAYYNNDYLLSPYFDLNQGYYLVKFSAKGAGKNTTLNVGLVSDKTDVAGTYAAKGSVKLPGYSYANEYNTLIQVEEAGKYSVAFFVSDVCGSDDYALEITKFVIDYQPVLPGLATDVAVVAAEDLSLAATISWTNPVDTNVEGVAPEIVKAEISRDGEVVGTLTEDLAAGAAAMFVDTTVPQAGEYTYTVTIYGPEGASKTAPTAVKSPWIGAGLELPWNCEEGFRDAGWTILNVNNDSNSWGDITWETSNSAVSITSSNNTPDDWAITPRLNFVAGKKYTIELTSYYGSGYEPIEWDLHFGTSLDPADMTVKIATIKTETASYPAADRQKDVFHLQAVTPDATPAVAFAPAEDAGEITYINVPAGVGAIGLHAVNKGAMGVSEFAIKPVADEIEVGVSDADADALVSVAGDKVYFAAAADVIVSDLAGRLQFSANGVEEISLSSLADGVYIVAAEISGKTIAVKVVK